MSAVSTTEAWPTRGQPFTVDDLDQTAGTQPWPRSPGLETLDTEQPFPVEVVPARLLAGLPGLHG